MKEFVHIPKDLWPNETENVNYDTIYRATKNETELTENDFLPWNIEHENQMRTFRNQFHRPAYGMSVFTELESLISKIKMYPALRMNTKTISKGKTNIEKGIAIKENTEHHVEYYLYDYIDNSPKDDFSIYLSKDELAIMVDENE